MRPSRPCSPRLCSPRLCALVVAPCLLLLCASSAGAHLIVGVNESDYLEASDPSFFFPTMQSEGLTMDALTLRWDDTQPTMIDPGDQAAISADVQAAASAGVTVELDLYPLHSQVFTDGARCAPSQNPQACGNSSEIAAFAAWTALVAQAFPTVHEFIVMNECNQPLFVNPQWNTAGQNQSAEICGRALAAAYDALKAVDPQNFVWGVGLSPRGNDNPNTTSNSSTSPVHFLEDLGAWFKAFARATGRTTPLMDGLDFHPYPIPQSLPLARGYADVNDASVANLPRIYQAFYDGFAGTPQPTIGQQRGGGLPLSLNEMGIQTAETGEPGYSGSEVSATPAGGVFGKYATQAYQSSYYTGMLALLACDPNVQVINLFHLVDESDLAGWQSGLYETAPSPGASPVAKLSAAAVQQWIASSGGNCQGKPRPWRPAPAPATVPSWVPAMVAEHNENVATVARLSAGSGATYGDCLAQQSSASPNWRVETGYVAASDSLVQRQLVPYARDVLGWVAALGKLPPTPAIARAQSELVGAYALHVAEDAGWVELGSALHAHDCTGFLAGTRAAGEAGAAAWVDDDAGVGAAAGLFGERALVSRRAPYPASV